MITDCGNVRVGLLGLGLQAYWQQFPGLRERLQGYVDEVGGWVRDADATLVSLGLVDTPQAAVEAGHACRREDIDLLLVYVTTYALSSTVLPVLQRAKVPVILLNLQPEAAIDYQAFLQLTDRTAMTGDWLAYCSSCPMPEIANVLRRLNLPFEQVTGVLHGDIACRNEVMDWVRAAAAVHALAHSNLGLMGHYYGGMLDVTTDLAQVSGRFGVHLEMLEVDELSSLRESVSTKELQAKQSEIAGNFDVQRDCSTYELERAARTSVALDRLAHAHRLDMLAYYYKGVGVPANEDTMSSIIVGTSLLTARGISVAGEYEVKNVLAMKLLNLLGYGGSFTEYYAVDFRDDVVLMGHDGPAHPAIAQGRVQVKPLQVYHGKVGSGLSVEMTVQHGPVTLLSVIEDANSGFRLLIAEGESVAGPTLPIGNTNSRYRFSTGAKRFLEAWNAQGPAHHCAVGVGHSADVLRKVAHLLQLPHTQVC